MTLQLLTIAVIGIVSGVQGAQPAGLDYSQCKPVTDKPFVVNPNFSTLCDTPSFADSVIKRGPHSQLAIRVLANDLAKAAMGKEKGFPVGSMIVKEKWDEESKENLTAEKSASNAKSAGQRPKLVRVAYGAMVKRPPGYDPKNGDWEYIFENLRTERVSRGKIDACRDCHSAVASRDYVFGTYLKYASYDEAEAAGFYRFIEQPESKRR